MSSAYKRLRDRLSNALIPYGLKPSNLGANLAAILDIYRGLELPPGLDIDHIIPLSKFDLTDPEQLRAAFALDNTQLLEKATHRKKTSRENTQSPRTRRPRPEPVVLDLLKELKKANENIP